VINQTINNTTVINNIRAHHANENIRGQRWWHEHNGNRYYHYYDHSGIHWYGFYIGTVYFYTRWYMDRFWWQDPYWHRWCYWHNGHWWYVDGSVTYIYENDNYYRYEDSTGGVILTPAPPEEAPTPDPGETAPPPPVEETDKFFYSEDGYRSVQIHLGHAYLYDRTQQNAEGGDLLLAELATDTPDVAAKDVKFSREQGEKLQVLVIYDDGTFARFDAWGARLDGETQPTDVVPVPVPPPAGEDLPEDRPDAPLRKGIRESGSFRVLEGLKVGWQN